MPGLERTVLTKEMQDAKIFIDKEGGISVCRIFLVQNLWERVDMEEPWYPMFQMEIFMIG